ncbi:MAG TPA: penicillin-binding protein 2 [Hyphomicrobiaceae bacterium]|nr:penicillin-binding protein 2 [Hyphomicrobiaceae bacterium]
MADSPRDEATSRRTFTRRALMLGLGQTGALGLLGARLYHLQVTEREHYARLAEANRTRTLAIPALRGRILDRTGRVLAGNETSIRVVVVPALAGRLQDVLRALARLVPLGEDEQAAIVDRARRQPPNLPVVVADEIAFEDAARINLLSSDLPGVLTEHFARRVYHGGAAVNHIVGYVGAPERPALGDDPVLRHPDVRVGKTGAELGLETTLRGHAGRIRREVDARGRIVRSFDDGRAITGTDVTLTIDLEVQKRVMQRMSQERRAALVALDCREGEIVAMASTPGYEHSDLSSPGRGTTEKSNSRLADEPFIDRTIRGLYPPGSTYKIVTALAALESGAVAPDEPLPCSGAFELAGHTFNCWKRSGHGSSNLVRALAQSCDCYFYEAARRTGIERLAATARLLGFGRTYDCGLALQRSGIVPDPDWKRGRYGRSWVTGETVLAGIGQGFVLTNPLQLAVMIARAASGLAIEPTLVIARPEDARGDALPLPVERRHLDLVRRGLVAAVNEDGGTGASARLDQEMGELAGKTGTAQVKRFSAATRWTERDHSLFVGYAPVAAPRYAIAAIVEHAGSGGAVAAPLVREVMQFLFDRDAPPGKPVGSRRS